MLLLRDNDIEMREAVNKLISASNNGNREYVRDAGADVVRDFFSDDEVYFGDADVLEALLGIFNDYELETEAIIVSRLLDALGPVKYSLPLGDVHFLSLIRKGDYQLAQREAAYKHIENWRVAIDIGGHVGFWANSLAERFETVFSFEPNPETFRCLAQNKSDNVIVHNFGLSNKREKRFLTYPDGSGTTEPDNSGAWEVSDDKHQGTYPIELHQLDSLSLQPDFIKIDVQGFELKVLEGGRETIIEHRPVILVELVAGKTVNEKAIDFIENELGMIRKDVVNKDYIYGW